MKKALLILGGLISTPAFAQDFSALQAIQNRNDNARDASIYDAQQEQARERAAEERRQQSITNSIVSRNRALAASQVQRNATAKANSDLDLEERRLRIVRERAEANHAEDFVKGDLDRQKAINSVIGQGKANITVNPVDSQ